MLVLDADLSSTRHGSTTVVLDGAIVRRDARSRANRQQFFIGVVVRGKTLASVVITVAVIVATLAVFATIPTLGAELDGGNRGG